MAFTFPYYDLVLAGVFASLLAGGDGGWLTPNPVTVIVPDFALVAVAIIGHGLFVDGPVVEPADLRRRCLRSSGVGWSRRLRGSDSTSRTRSAPSRSIPAPGTGALAPEEIYRPTA